MGVGSCGTLVEIFTLVYRVGKSSQEEPVPGRQWEVVIMHNSRDPIRLGLEPVVQLPLLELRIQTLRHSKVKGKGGS